MRQIGNTEFINPMLKRGNDDNLHLILLIWGRHMHQNFINLDNSLHPFDEDTYWDMLIIRRMMEEILWRKVRRTDETTV